MPDVPAAAPANDVGADLSAAWDQVEAGSPEPAPEPDTSASPPSSEPSPSPEGGGDAGRARGPDGKFISKPEVPDGAQVQAPVEFRVPEKWPADVRAELEAMHKANPAHAEFVLRQYEHFRKVAGQQAQFQDQRAQKLLTTQKQVEDLLAPGRQQRALKGVDDASYIRNLVAAGDFLDKDPIGGLKFLAKQYGVDLGNLDALGAGAQAIPPEVQRVMQENAEIKALLLSQHQGTQEHQLREAGDWINRFAAQADPQGQPLYPYFDEVLNEIITLVQHQMSNGQQVDVHAAYKSAIRMNDNVWLKEQTRTSEASRKDAEAKRLREIEDAKRAGFSASGSGGASEQPMDNLRDELSRQYDKFLS